MRLVDGQQLILAILAWPTIVIIICFILYFSIHSRYYYSQDGRDQIPTISVSGSLSPSSLIFTYGLHLEAVLLVIFFYLLFQLYERKIENRFHETVVHGDLEDNGNNGNTEENKNVHIDLPSSHAVTEQANPLQVPLSPINTVMKKDETETFYARGIVFLEAFTCFGCSICQCAFCYCHPFAFDTDVQHTHLNKYPAIRDYLHYWNRVLLGFGLFASFCMSLVGTISLNVNEEVHGFFAFLMFSFGIFHAVFFYYHLTRHVGSFQRSSLWSIFCHQLCIFITLPLNIIMTIVNGIVYIACAHTSNTCETFVFNLFPALEFTTIIFILLYVASFYDEIGQLSLDVVDHHKTV